MIQDHIFNKHRDCEVVIDENPISKKGVPVRGQLACLRCVTCNKWLKWLSPSELIALGKITQEEYNEWRAIQNEIPPRDASMISLDQLPRVPVR